MLRQFLFRQCYFYPKRNACLNSQAVPWLGLCAFSLARAVDQSLIRERRSLKPCSKTKKKEKKNALSTRSRHLNHIGSAALFPCLQNGHARTQPGNFKGVVKRLSERFFFFFPSKAFFSLQVTENSIRRPSSGKALFSSITRTFEVGSHRLNDTVNSFEYSLHLSS